jgi:hypothetical protein
MEDYQQIITNKLRIVTELKASRDEILNGIQSKKSRVEKIIKAMSDLLEAKHIIASEMTNIQKTLKEDIDSLVTIALKIVYEGRDVEFSLEFGKTPSGVSTYKPFIIENGEKYDPKEEQCGGALDVSSYNLQTILKAFEKPIGRPFRLNDEPFKFLGGGILAERAFEMAKTINTEMSIQSILISHDEAAIASADVIYRITHNGIFSNATLLKREEKPKINRIAPTKLERVKPKLKRVRA